MASQDLMGRVLSHYRIIQSIGAGGMGEVYLAEDTQLDRKVALKVLPPDLASDRDRMSRFVREAKAASAMCFAKSGKTKDAEAVLAELLEGSKKSYVPEFYLACLYGSLEKNDEAFEWLDRAYTERANGLSVIKVIPLVDDLRSDPRFDALLKRLKLD